MTCFTRCGSGCCPNTPNPIWVFGSCSNNNNVINPVILSSFGFFQNTLGGPVVVNGIIPVTLANSQGSKITASTTTAGTVNLTPGTYEITYFVNATIPASTNVTVGLRANGIPVVGSTVTATGTATNQTTISKTIVLTVTANTTLELFNAGVDTLTISNANIVVKEL